jgi:hypothetical protein
VASSTSYGNAGFAAGALLAGLIADQWGLTSAVWVVAALTAGSGLVVAARIYETRSVQAPAAGVSISTGSTDAGSRSGGVSPGPGTGGHRAHTTLDL